MYNMQYLLKLLSMIMYLCVLPYDYYNIMNYDAVVAIS